MSYYFTALKLLDLKFGWLVRPSSQMVKKGDSIDITCLSTFGNVSVIWTKDGTLLKNDNSKIVIEKVSLHIINAEDSDNGTYECIIMYGHKSLQAQASITIRCKGLILINF